MPKKKEKKMVISAMDIWKACKPKYNGYACGHGPHGDTKYNRCKEKQRFEKEEW